MKNQIKGGKADKKKPSDFDSKQLAVGTKIEMEHTKDKAKAKEIAMDHLSEDKDYYKDWDKKEKILFQPKVKKSIDNLIDEFLNKADEDIKKKQGVPKGVDPAKHERCVKEVKKQGKDKSSAYAICNSSIKKSEELNMSDINKEIDEMSETMEKSTKDPKDLLKSTIIKLGPEGIKKALPTLSDEQRFMLTEVLQDMKKSMEFSDKEIAAERKRESIVDTKFDVDKADDDADEKLVKPEAAQHNHQGDVTPEGREGQVIKSLSEDLECEESLVKGLFPEPVKEVSTKEMTKDDAYWRLKSCIRQLKDMKESIWEIRSTVEDEIPEAKKVLEAKYNSILAEARKLVKQYSSLKKSKEELIEMKDSIIKSFQEQNIEFTDEMVKSEIRKACMRKANDDKKEKKDNKKIADAIDNIAENEAKEEVKDHEKKMHKKKMKKGDELTDKDAKKPEDDQVGDGSKGAEGSSRANNEMPDNLKNDAETKADDVAVPTIKKSVAWGDPQAKLRANTLGRNHHFSVNGYYDDAIKKSKEEPKTEETLNKSETENKKDDINDLIEKGMDMDSAAYQTEQIMKSHQVNGNQSSFNDVDLAEAFNMTEEELKEILGE